MQLQLPDTRQWVLVSL